MADVDELYSKAVSLSEAFDENFFELGRTLMALKDAHPEKYQQAVKKAGLGTRKAYYLVNIARAFNGLGVPKNRLHRVGWTKLQLICNHVTKVNVDEKLTMAEKHTVAEINEILRGEDPLANAKTVLLRFSPKEYAEFQKALLEHGGKRSGRGIVDKEKALLDLIQSVSNGLDKPKK